MLKVAIRIILILSLISSPPTKSASSKSYQVAYITTTLGGVSELYLVDAVQATVSAHHVVDVPKGKTISEVFSDNNNWVGLQFERGQIDLSVALLNIKTGQIRSLIDGWFAFSNYSFSTLDRQENFNWSPDGKTLAFTGMQGDGVSRAYLYSLATQKVRMIDAGIAEVFQIVWASDSQKVVVEGETCHTDYNDCSYKIVTIRASDQVIANRIDILSTAPASLGNEAAFCNLSLSPDQRYVSYVSGCDSTSPETEKEVYLWDIKNQSLQKITAFTELPLKSLRGGVGAEYDTYWYNSNELLISVEVSIDYVLYNELDLYLIAQKTTKIIASPSVTSLAVNPVSGVIVLSNSHYSPSIRDDARTLTVDQIDLEGKLTQLMTMPVSCSAQWSDDGLMLLSAEIAQSGCPRFPQRLRFFASSWLNSETYMLLPENPQTPELVQYAGWVH